MGECWAGPQFKFSKPLEVGWSCSDLQLCQCEIATDEIQERNKKIERSNIKSARVSARAQCHAKGPRRGRAFQHSTGIEPIGLQTLVVIDSESFHRAFPSFCAPPSEVAVLFDSNLSRRPVLRQVIDLDLLDSIRNMLFCSYVICLLRDQ